MRHDASLMQTDDDPIQFDPRLLDLRLSALSAEEAAQVRGLVAQDSRLAQMDAQLQETLGALNAWRVDAPSDLGPRLLASLKQRIAMAPALKTTKAAGRRTGGPDNRPVLLQMGSLRDLLAAAAAIVLLVGMGVPGVLNMRARNQRIGCSHNLAMLGQGLQQYAATYASALPFSGWNARKSWLATEAANQEVVANRQHMYPLLQAAFVADPRLFICPSQRDVPMTRQLVTQCRTFPDVRNLSYAYYNMAGVRPSVDDNPALPILADDNPLFADGVPMLDLRRWLQSDPNSINSRAHRGAGQNVLSLDGHVQFATTPRVGLDGDNIWTLQNVAEYTGREGPRIAGDAHLLK